MLFCCAFSITSIVASVVPANFVIGFNLMIVGVTFAAFIGGAKFLELTPIGSRGNGSGEALFVSDDGEEGLSKSSRELS